MMDIVKLLREAGDVYHDIARDMLQNEWKEHLAPHYTQRGDELKLAAAELEGGAEPDYWGAVTEDGHIELGMREPTTDDDGAKWCARTEVNQHINDRMLEHPELRLHLEPLYRRPLTERAVPEGYMKVTRELMNFLCSVGHHGAEIGDEGQPYEIGIDEIEYAQNLFTQLHDAAPGAGGGE